MWGIFANAITLQGPFGGLMIGNAAVIAAALGPVETRFSTSLGTIVLGGILVGFGTRCLPAPPAC